MARPKIVLFDLDGTLIDTREIVARVYSEGLKLMGLQSPSLKEIMSLSGRSTYATGRGLGVPNDRLEEIDHWFWSLFGSFCEDPDIEPMFFEEVPQVLQFLKEKEIEMGIVTSNESKNARLLLEKANLERYFTAIVGFREVEEPKPSAEPIEKAIAMICDRSGMKIDLTREVWMVGDSDSDLQSAKNAGVQPLILGYNLKSLEDLMELVED